MNPTYATDETIDAMKNSEKAMAVMYSGDAASVLSLIHISLKSLFVRYCFCALIFGGFSLAIAMILKL